MRFKWANLLQQFWFRSHCGRSTVNKKGRPGLGMRRRRTGRLPAVEAMEARTLLAGTPTLSVALNSLTVVETNFSNGIPATVTRTDGDLGQAVTVSLFSSDTSEATVPASVTISAGATSANFLAMPADDALLDGPQNVQITAAASGYTYASSVTAAIGLDATFGTSGYATVPQAWALSSVYPDLLIQPNGSIVSFSQTPNVGNGWTLVRRTATGGVDSGFGTNGTVNTTFTGSNVAATSLLLQSDGKILAVGHVSGGTSIWDDLLVVRYNTNGQRDISFGSDGVVRIERATHTNLKDAAVLSDGTILLAGAEGNNNFLAKLNANGSVNTAFGTNGFAISAASGFNYTQLKNIFVQSDGKILAAGTGQITGTNEAGVFTARYLANGAVDTAYGVNGLRTLNFNPTAANSTVLLNAVLQSDGKMVLAAQNRLTSTGNYDWAVARLNTDGTFDTTFSGDGFAILDFATLTDYANDLVIQPDGRILVMGSAAIPPNGYDLAFARFNTDGTLDTTFDGDGKLTLPAWPGTVFEQVWAGELTSNGQLAFLGGYNTDMRIGRLNIGLPTPVRDTLTVTDNETLTVLITPTSASEAAGAGAVTATVTRSNTADMGADLTVALTSSDTTELTVPASVVIPAGQASTTFSIDAIDDQITDGTQTVTIQATAAGYLSLTDSLAVTDDDTNIAPAATGQVKFTNEDTAVTGQLAATDADGDPLTYSLYTAPTHGQVTINANGSFTYTPAANYYGSDLFFFRAFDGRAYSNIADVGITINPVNDAPVANNDSYTLNEDTVLTTVQPIQAVTRIQMVSDPGDWIGQGRTYDFTTGITASVSAWGNLVRVNYANPNNSNDYFTFEFDSPSLNQPLAVGTYLGATRYPFNPDGTPGLSVTGQFRGSNTLTGFFTIEQIAYNANGQLLNFRATFEQHSEGGVPALRGTVQYNATTATPNGVLSNDTDPEGHTLVAALATSPEHGSVVLNPNGTFTYTPHANYYGTDSFTYVAGDGALTSAPATVTLTIGSVDDAPTIVDQSFTADENTLPVASLGTVIASDGDVGQSLTYAITSSTHPGAFAVDAQTGELTVIDGSTLNYEQATSAVITVTVTDSGNPALSSSATVTVHLNDINEVPRITSTTLNVDEDPANGTTFGPIVAVDQDAGQTLTYQLETNLNGILTINPVTGVLTVVDGSWFSYESGPERQFFVGVSDGLLSSSQLITITLNDINDPPIVYPVAFWVDENVVNFTPIGTVSVLDPDPGQSVTFALTSSTLPGAFAIDAANGSLSVLDGSLLNFEAIPSATVVVTATDNGSPARSTSQSITIHLNDKNEPPVIADQAFAVAENSANGTVAGTVAASDVDAGQTLTYRIVDTTLSGAFAINAQTGQVTVANTALLNYESVPSVTLTVSVEDNGVPIYAEYALVTIAVTNANDTPTIANQTFSIREYLNQGLTVGDVVAADEDFGQTLTYSIVATTLPDAFMILPSTGRILVSNAFLLDYETVPSIMLTVRATDNGTPARSRDALVTVNLTDVNESPVMDAQSFGVAENAANGTVVGTVLASDVDAGQSLTYEIFSSPVPGAFAINASNGQITVANGALLNYESRTSIELALQVTDNGSPVLGTFAPITILLTDVNEAPAAPNRTFSVAENAAAGTTVGTVTATDPDAGQSLSFAITAGNTNNAFAINAATGAITVNNAAALNFETTPTFNLTVTVTDNGSPTLSSTAAITINLTNVNEAPIVTAATFTVAENSVAGTAVGTVSATDPDAGQTRTFAITAGNTNNAFAINAATGAITVNNAAALNFEASPTFNLTVTVTDNGVPALSSTAAITINLTNVNEAPVVTAATFSVAENSAAGTAVGTVSATDPDAGQTRTFAITAGNTNNAFAINAATGAITVNNAAALNFEATPTFNLTVTATDNGVPARTASATVTVNLTNVNEAPVVTAQSFAIKTKSKANAAVGTVASSDPDVGQTRTYAIVSGNGSASKPVFAINATTGAITVKTASSVTNAGTFTLGVRVTDNGSPSLSTTANITIYVNATGTIPVGVRTSVSTSPRSVLPKQATPSIVIPSAQTSVTPPQQTTSSTTAPLPTPAASPRTKSLTGSIAEWLKRRR